MLHVCRKELERPLLEDSNFVRLPIVARAITVWSIAEGGHDVGLDRFQPSYTYQLDRGPSGCQKLQLLCAS